MGDVYIMLRFRHLQSFIYLYGKMKREGSDLAQLERQAKSSDKLCFWGIEKFFDPKQCYKFYKKNFEEVDTLTHLCKMRNKPFFIAKFREPQHFEEFNSKYGKGKRVKARALTEDVEQKNNIKEQDYLSIQEIQKPAEKRFKEASPEEIEAIQNTKIEDIVAPLHSLPYDIQVQQKVKDLSKVIEKYNTAYFRDNEVSRLIKEEKKELAPLKMDKFIECPQEKREGYRSKSQFTIGKDEEGKPIIGFNKGNYFNNTIMVESPKNVNIISKNTKLIVALVQNQIRSIMMEDEFKQFGAFDRISQEGFWRYLVVRESQRTKQSLVVIVARTEGFDQEKVEKIKAKIVEYLKSAIIGLKGLCFLSYNGEADCIPPQKPELLWGTPFYQEQIFDHTFQVSPSAFLQINLDMCEILYQKIIESVKECEIILDLGCGIGTIGISIMKKLPNVKVIGIEICEEAVEDARINEPNYEVHLGRAEDLIKNICEQHRGKRIVAILDPPRPGFNKEVMQAMRRTRGLDNLIYVACNAGAIQDNLLQLTLPVTNKRKAPGFEINEMYGLDLFPQTAHYQALYIMQRKY